MIKKSSLSVSLLSLWKKHFAINHCWKFEARENENVPIRRQKKEENLWILVQALNQND